MFEDSNKEDDFLSQKRREREKAANASDEVSSEQYQHGTLMSEDNELDHKSTHSESQNEFMERFNTDSLEQLSEKNVVINADISQPPEKSGVLKKVLIVFGCLFGIFAIWFVSQLIININSQNPKSYDKLDEQAREALNNVHLKSGLYIVEDSSGSKFSICLYEYPDPGKCGYLDFYDTRATLLYKDNSNEDFQLGYLGDCSIDPFASDAYIFNTNNDVLKDTLRYNASTYEKVDKTKPYIGSYEIYSGDSGFNMHKEYAIGIFKQSNIYDQNCVIVKTLDGFEIKEITLSELETIVANWAQEYGLSTSFDEYMEQRVSSDSY